MNMFFSDNFTRFVFKHTPPVLKILLPVASVVRVLRFFSSHPFNLSSFLVVRVVCEYRQGSEVFDTSPKMRPPAWTDRILFSPGGPSGVSVLEYNSEPGSSHSDHRPVYATFRVRLED